MSEETEKTEAVEETTEHLVEDKNPAVQQSEDGTIKVDLSSLNAKEEVNEPEAKIEQPKEQISEKPEEDKVVLENNTPETFLEEITDEEVTTQAEQLSEDIKEAVEASDSGKIDLPENIQKVVDFINETNGTLEDYVRLNQDYSKLDEAQLLREYYQSTKPHLDADDIDFLMEDNFAYDEDMDEERDIRRKKLARREELSKAKTYLDSLKTKYYDEIKSGSRLNPDQQKAVEFFNRYKQENEEATKLAEKSTQTFLNKTNQVFNNEFKGFDYKVGDKRYRFNVKDANSVKETQSDINNFVKKFLNDKNEMSDAAGYHKSLFTAMNADAVANHFYEQGKADAMKSSMQKSKNIDMNPRGTHEKVTTSNGWTIRAVPSDNVSSSKLRIKK